MTPEIRRGQEYTPVSDATQPTSTLHENSARLADENTRSDEQSTTQQLDTGRSIALADDMAPDAPVVPERDTSPAASSGIGDEPVHRKPEDRPSPRPRTDRIAAAAGRTPEPKTRVIREAAPAAAGTNDASEKVVIRRAEAAAPTETDPSKPEQTPQPDNLVRLLRVKNQEYTKPDGSPGEKLHNRPEQGRVADALQQGETLVVDISHSRRLDGTAGDVVTTISEAFRPPNAVVAEAAAPSGDAASPLQGTPDDPVVHVRVHGVRKAIKPTDSQNPSGNSPPEVEVDRPGMSIEGMLDGNPGDWRLRYEVKPVSEKQREKVNTRIDIAKHDAGTTRSTKEDGTAGKFDAFQAELAEAGETVGLRRVIVSGRRSEIDRAVSQAIGRGLPQSPDITWERQVDDKRQPVYHLTAEQALKSPPKLDDYVSAERVATGEVAFVKTDVPGMGIERGYNFAQDRNLPPGETVIPFGRIKTNGDKLSKPYPLTRRDFGKNIGVFSETGGGKTVAKVQLTAGLAVERYNAKRAGIEDGTARPLKVWHLEVEKAQTAQDLADWFTSCTELPSELCEFYEHTPGSPDEKVRMIVNPFTTRGVPSEEIAIERGVKTVLLASKTEDSQEVRMFETYVGGGARRAFSMVKNPSMRFIAKCIREDVAAGTFDNEVTGNLGEVGARTLLKILDGASGAAFDYGHEGNYEALMDDPAGFSRSLQHLPNIARNLVVANDFTMTRYKLKAENGGRNVNDDTRCLWVLDEAYEVFRDTAATEDITKAPATTRGDAGAMMMVTQSPGEIAEITRRNLGTTVALAMDADEVVAGKLGITDDKMGYLKSTELRPMLVKTSGTDLPARVEALDPSLAETGSGTVHTDMTKFMHIGLHEKPQKWTVLKEAREFLDEEMLGAKLEVWAQTNVIAVTDRRKLSRPPKAIKGEFKARLQAMDRGPERDKLSAALVTALEDACAPRVRNISDEKARKLRDFMFSQIRDEEPMQPEYPDTRFGRLAEAEDRLVAATTAPPIHGEELKAYEAALGRRLNGRTSAKQLENLDKMHEPLLAEAAAKISEIGAQPEGEQIEIETSMLYDIAKLLGGSSNEAIVDLVGRVQAKLERSMSDTEGQVFSTLVAEAIKLIPTDPEAARAYTLRSTLADKVKQYADRDAIGVSDIDGYSFSHAKAAGELQKVRAAQAATAEELGTERKNDIVNVVYAPSMHRDGEALDELVSRFIRLQSPQSNMSDRLRHELGVGDGRLYSILKIGDGDTKDKWITTITNEIASNRVDFEMSEAERTALINVIDDATSVVINNAIRDHAAAQKIAANKNASKK